MGTSGKKIQRSVHFETSTDEIIRQRAKISSRTFSAQIEHDLKKLWAIQEKNQKLALAMAEQGTMKPVLPQ